MVSSCHRWVVVVLKPTPSSCSDSLSPTRGGFPHCFPPRWPTVAPASPAFPIAGGEKTAGLTLTNCIFPSLSGALGRLVFFFPLCPTLAGLSLSYPILPSQVSHPSFDRPRDPFTACCPLLGLPDGRHGWDARASGQTRSAGPEIMMSGQQFSVLDVAIPIKTTSADLCTTKVSLSPPLSRASPYSPTGPKTMPASRFVERALRGGLCASIADRLSDASPSEGRINAPVLPQPNLCYCPSQ